MTNDLLILAAGIVGLLIAYLIFPKPKGPRGSFWIEDEDD